MKTLPTALKRQPELVLWLMAGYFCLCIALRIMRSDILQNDEAEQAFISQFMLLGHGRQPPLYDWLQASINAVLGLSIFSLSLLKNALLFLCCLFYGFAARQVVEDRVLPLTAAVGLLAVPSISILAQRDLTHAVATFLFVSLFLLAFLSTLKRPNLTNYVGLGTAVGLGILTKYNFIIIPCAAAIAVMLQPEFRSRMLDWRIIPAILVACIIPLPHIVWLFQHLNVATAGTIEAMREGASGDTIRDFIRGFSSILVSSLKGTLPVLLLFSLAFYQDLNAIWKASSPWTRIMGWVIVLCFVFVALIGLSLEASNIRQKWLSPFQMLLPLYLTLKIDAARLNTRDSLARIAPPVLIIVVLSAFYVAIANLAGPYFGRYNKEHVPYAPMLAEITRAHGAGPAVLVTDDLMTAGNARLQFSTLPVLMPDLQPVPLQTALGRGDGLVVWPVRDGKEGLSYELDAFLDKSGYSRQKITISYINVPYSHSQDSDGAFVRFAYFWLMSEPPAKM